MQDIGSGPVTSLKACYTFKPKHHHQFAKWRTLRDRVHACASALPQHKGAPGVQVCATATPERLAVIASRRTAALARW